MKIDIADTYIGKSSNVKDHARNARKFLLDNVNRITFSHDDETKLLGTHDSMTRTVMSDLYQQAFNEQKLDIFKLLILDKVDKIPSGFLISWLDIDTLELRSIDKQSAEVLNTISDYRDKILVDITPYYSDKRKSITDTTSFHARLIRNMLCRSYFKADKLWLTYNLISQLTKFYATILSAKIGKIYNLTFQEQQVAATALSIYFLNRCSDTTGELPDWSMIGKTNATKPIYDYINEKYNGTTYDLNAVVDVIIEFGPARISKFTLATFYTMNQTLTSNQLISLIALEYPPYWCHLILSALSGDKTGMFHSIKSLNLKADTMMFQTNLVKTSSFIHSL